MKNNHLKNFQNFFLIIYQNYLLFATNEYKSKLNIKIKFKYALRHIEVQFDKFDPRCLNLIAKEKGAYVDLFIGFDEMNKSSIMKKILEENRKSSKNTEYLLFDSYFENLLMKVNYQN